MKVTAYDPDYSYRVSSGLTVGSVASNDLSGSLTAPTVVGIQGVAIASNPPTAVGQVLTVSQVAPPQAIWAVPSNAVPAFGSNVNDVGVVSFVGASSNTVRADHVHRGVVTVSHTSNSYSGPVTLVAGANVGITSGATGSLTISASAPASATTYGSNSTDVGASTTGGTASSSARSDHYHRGVSGLAASSNVLYGSLTVAPADGAAVTANTTTGIVTIHGTRVAVGSNAYSGTVTLLAGPNVGITSPSANQYTITAATAPGGITLGTTATDVAATTSAGAAATASRSDHQHRGVSSVVVGSNTIYGATTLASGAGAAITTVGNTATISGGTVSHTSNTFRETTVLSGPGVALTSPGAGRLQIDGTTIAASSNTLSGPVSLVPATGAAITANVSTETITVHGTQVSHTSNTFGGNVTLLAGPNVSITSPGTNRLQIAAAAGGAAGVTSVAASSNAYTGAVVFGGGGIVGVVSPSSGNISVVGPAFGTGTTATVTDAPTVGTQHAVARADHSHYGVVLVSHSSNAIAGQVNFAPGAGIAFTQPSAGQLNVTGTTVAHTSNTFGVGTTLLAGPGIGITTPGNSRFQLTGTTISHASNSLAGPISLVSGAGIALDSSVSTETITLRGTTISVSSNTYGGPVTLIPGAGVALTQPSGNTIQISTRNNAWQVAHYDNIATTVSTTLGTANTYTPLTSHEVSFTPHYVGQRWLLTLSSYASLVTTVAQDNYVRCDIVTAADGAIVTLGYSRSQNYGVSGRGSAVSFSRVWNADRTATVKFKLYGTATVTNTLSMGMSFTQMEAIPLW